MWILFWVFSTPFLPRVDSFITYALLVNWIFHNPLLPPCWSTWFVDDPLCYHLIVLMNFFFLLIYGPLLCRYIISLHIFVYFSLCVFFLRKCVHDFILCAVVSLQNTLLRYVYKHILLHQIGPVFVQFCVDLVLVCC